MCIVMRFQESVQDILAYASLHNINHVSAMAMAQHMRQYKNYRLLHTRVPENVSSIEKLHITLYLKYRERERGSNAHRYAPALYQLIRMKKYVVFVRPWCGDPYVFDKYTKVQVHTYTAYEVRACARMLNYVLCHNETMVFCIDG